MIKLLTTAVLIAFVTMSPACAQDAQAPAQPSPQNGGSGLRNGNITSTGETVPNPGASQGAGTTGLDRGIQREDQKIDSSICKGC